MGKLLGIDFGERRVGIAITDNGKTVVFPRGALKRSTDEGLIKDIRALCEKESIESIVIGVPLNIDDEETERSVRIRSFAEKLAASIYQKIFFQDEHGSTQDSIKIVPNVKLKTDRDALAAQQILKRFLIERMLDS